MCSRPSAREKLLPLDQPNSQTLLFRARWQWRSVPRSRRPKLSTIDTAKQAQLTPVKSPPANRGAKPLETNSYRKNGVGVTLPATTFPLLAHAPNSGDQLARSFARVNHADVYCCAVCSTQGNTLINWTHGEVRCEVHVFYSWSRSLAFLG